MPTTIKVCHGHACAKNLSKYTFDRAKADLGITDEEGGLSKDKKVKLEKCACQGRCAKGPTVVIEKGSQSFFNDRTDPVEIGKLIKKHKK